MLRSRGPSTSLECKAMNSRYLALILLGGIFPLAAPVTTTAAETPKDDLAAQIRTQGIACGKALSAKRDARRSRPDYEVWVLKCDNATYRVSRYPDMAAKVEQLR
jgi:hypothetical protein